jgi:hypothetical protein
MLRFPGKRPTNLGVRDGMLAAPEHAQQCEQPRGITFHI